MSDAHEHVRSGCVHALGHDGPCEVARGDYDAVLDGLVEKSRLMKRSGSPDWYEDLGEAVPRHVLRAIDAPSLVLLLREARDELVEIRDAYLGPDPSNLIARIDAHLAPQPSTSPADV